MSSFEDWFIVFDSGHSFCKTYRIHLDAEASQLNLTACKVNVSVSAARIGRFNTPAHWMSNTDAVIVGWNITNPTVIEPYVGRDVFFSNQGKITAQVATFEFTDLVFVTTPPP